MFILVSVFVLIVCVGSCERVRLCHLRNPGRQFLPQHPVLCFVVVELHDPDHCVDVSLQLTIKAESYKVIRKFTYVYLSGLTWNLISLLLKLQITNLNYY